ncbi:MAG TPA: hypothetical protein VGJ94_15885 [Syntrophorhabdaceae bacterium]|jgi:hypothetical protein
MKRYLKFVLPLLILAVLSATFFSIGTLKAGESEDPAEQAMITEDEVAGASGEPARSADAFDAIGQAVDNKEMTLKEAVMLKARLLFDPHSAASDTKSSVLKGNTRIDDPCLTGFYKDVHRVFEEFSVAERGYLRNLSPDLNVIFRAKEKELSGAQATADGKADLPDFGLNKTVEGVHCTVNYADSGEHQVTAVYAQLVKVYIDGAYAAETKKFRPALAEPGGTGDKLQVYIVNMTAGTWGEWIDVSTVAGKTKSGYIKISKNISTEGGKSWQVSLKGTCYHEYFHGVQSAYNWASSLWFMEGTCRWAETFYAANWKTLTNTFAANDSVFRAPYLPIWQNTFRKYSTVALAYYFADKYGKADFILSYFEATENKDDAIEILKDLMVAKGTTFGDQFKNFWIAMYTKNIKSIKSYMIDVTKEYASTYGLSLGTTVRQLGARFHQLKTMAGIPKATLIYNYLPGAGMPVEAFTFTTKAKTAVNLTPATAGNDNWHYTAGFGGTTKEVIMVYTDVTYAGEDATDRTVDFTYLLPYMKITRTTVSPTVMEAGNYSTITFTYDLLGTISTENFQMTMKVTEKLGPQTISDGVSGDWTVPVGTGNDLTVYFNTGTSSTPGTYRFTFLFSVPSDLWLTDWGTPQVTSTSKFGITVRRPAAGKAGNEAPVKPALVRSR